MVLHDPLYFLRTDYARMLVSSLKDGVSHAFTLFAPRRMGKTEFLLKDIKPLAEQSGFNVFYYSFMDGENPASDFQASLERFAVDIQSGGKAKSFIGSISKVDIAGFSIERQASTERSFRLSELIELIAADNHPTLLLLDEVQELARIKNTEGLIKSLRTGLDKHKDQIKTIFTGSSTNGLRVMFNDNKAPFFHFAHSLDFPLLGQEFTDFLADKYEERTRKKIERGQLYQAFQAMQFTPLYMRSSIQDMILNPALSIEQATKVRIEQMHENSNYPGIWKSLTAIEKLLLQQIAQGNTAVYSDEIRRLIAEQAGLERISTSTIQGNIRKLERKELLTKSGGTWGINSPLFQTWIVESTS